MATNSVYGDRFDPVQYYTDFYTSSKANADKMLEFLYKHYNSDKLKGNTFLDLCCGPTMHWSAPPSLKYSDITLADLLNSNLVQVNKWLQKDQDAIDWTQTFNRAAHAEGISDHTVIEDRVRKAVKHVVLCDVLQENPLLNITKQFDAVQCIMGVCSAAKDPDTLKVIIKNISNVVKPGGVLIMMNAWKATYYKVGSETFPKIYITRETLQDALVGAGFEDIEITDFRRSDCSLCRSDAKAILLSIAFKSQ